MTDAARPPAEALVVGMALVPGFASRNKSFQLFLDPEVRRARRRAALLRGIVKQLAGAHGKIDGPVVARSGDRFELRYALPGLRVGRRWSLSETELACVKVLATLGGVPLPGLAATDDDRAHIDSVLLKLA